MAALFQPAVPCHNELEGFAGFGWRILDPGESWRSCRGRLVSGCLCLLLDAGVIVCPKGTLSQEYLALTCAPHGHTLSTMARPKKEEERAHSASIRIRLTPGHDVLIRQAAELAGVSLSDWIRERLIRSARKELSQAV